jgi:hypothetical protein
MSSQDPRIDGQESLSLASLGHSVSGPPILRRAGRQFFAERSEGENFQARHLPDNRRSINCWAAARATQIAGD